jgi:FMN phosphatase YigB (HAD superfamily)
VLGIRKPNPEIFKHALKTIGCNPEEVVFLDDIGSNLKAAGKLGIRCIRVRIGKESEAVVELEKVMGLRLTTEKARL